MAGSATDAKLTSNAISLQGKTNVTITFSWYIQSTLDTGEYLAFDVSTNNGATWSQMAILRGNVDPENVWRNVTVNVNGITTNSLRLQFRGRMDRSDEHANVDNIRVIAN